MKAVRLYGTGDLRVETVDRPLCVAEDAILLQVDAAGICGSDTHNFRTGQWISRAPSIPGHELAGTVLAFGPAVTGFAIGDRVVADSRVWCGACPACRRGRPNLCASLGYVGEVCDGGFAEAVVLPARLLHRVDPAIAPRVAAMAEPLAVALHAVKRLRVQAGATVLVVGCGPIGGLIALVLRRAGHPVLIADRNAARCQRVASITGAVHITLDATAPAAALGDEPLLYAVEAAGSVAALQALLATVANGAAIALVGISHGRLDLDPNMLVEREITTVGCSAFADELPDAIARLPALAADLEQLIDRVVSLDAVPDAYRSLIAGEVSGLKVIVEL